MQENHHSVQDIKSQAVAAGLRPVSIDIPVDLPADVPAGPVADTVGGTSCPAPVTTAPATPSSTDEPLSLPTQKISQVPKVCSTFHACTSVLVWSSCDEYDENDQ
jgi:hypothetical protein